MPATRTSILNSPGPSLLPGEDHVKLVDDPFYGSVDIGDGPLPGKVETPKALTARLQRGVLGGVYALDGDEQNLVEVMTGVRLQQRAGMKREDLPPQELPAPELSHLAPNTAVLGSTNFTMRVLGKNFDDGAIIVFNGGDEPTERVSDTELTTLINMATAQVAVTVPVLVRNTDGQETAPMDFTFTDPIAGGEGRETSKVKIPSSKTDKDNAKRD